MSELSMPGGRGDPSPLRGFPIVEAIGISKRYGATTALNGAHIRVMPGESHALVGRTGAGKSTLARDSDGLTASLDVVGRVRFSGEAALRRSRTGRAGDGGSPASISSKHSTIIPDLTVAENLLVNRQPTRRAASSAGARCAARRATFSTSGGCRCRRTCAPETSRSKRASSWRSPARSRTAPASSSSMSRPRSSTATRSSGSSSACANCR